MTLENTQRSVTYRGNGSAVDFPYTFPIPEAAAAVVTIQDFETGFVVETIPAGEFTITGIGNDGGGTVTYEPVGGPLTDDFNIVIERIVVYNQPLVLDNYGGFYPETLELQLDRTVMQIQQIAARITQSLTVPTGYVGYTIQANIAENALLMVGPLNTIVAGPTVSEISNAEGWAQFARLWAVSDVLVDDGIHVPDYSSKHYADIAQTLVAEAEQAVEDGIAWLTGQVTIVQFAAGAGVIPLPSDPGSANNVHLVIGGAPQNPANYSKTGTGPYSITLSTLAPEAGWLSYGNAVGINTPADGSVTETKYADQSIGSTKYKLLSILTGAIADTAVTAAKLAANLAGIGAKIPDNEIPLTKIANNGATARLIGRVTAGSGRLEEITKDELRDVLLPTGSVIASSYNENGSQAVITGFTPFVSGAAPTIAMGEQFLTRTFTGKAGTNRLRIRYQGMISCSTVTGVIAALFDGNTCIHAAAVTIGTINHYYVISGEVEIAATTSAKTISLRIMSNNGSHNILMNGTQSIANFLGVVPKTTLIIEEIRG